MPAAIHPMPAKLVDYEKTKKLRELKKKKHQTIPFGNVSLNILRFRHILRPNESFHAFSAADLTI
jgi:hypothetical protein